MTEADMKTKWCPHAREMAGGIPAMPSTNGTRDFACIGSACSQWRWERQFVVVRGEPIPLAVFEPKGAYTPDQLQHDGHGYCGLAGKP